MTKSVNLDNQEKLCECASVSVTLNIVAATTCPFSYNEREIHFIHARCTPRRTIYG